MRNRQNFWDKNAGRYDRFMRKDAAAYERLYGLLRPVVRQKTVLELATGTGLIAKHIVRYADHIEATDASQKMIEQAKQGVKSAKLYFSVQDTAKYIRRMEKRLAEKPHECEIETMVYAHGTHFVFPEGMLKTMLPVGSGLFVKLAFQAAKKYSMECSQTRKDIEKRMNRTLAEWKGAK